MLRGYGGQKVEDFSGRAAPPWPNATRVARAFGPGGAFARAVVVSHVTSAAKPHDGPRATCAHGPPSGSTTAATGNLENSTTTPQSQPAAVRGWPYDRDRGGGDGGHASSSSAAIAPLHAVRWARDRAARASSRPNGLSHYYIAASVFGGNYGRVKGGEPPLRRYARAYYTTLAGMLKTAVIDSTYSQLQATDPAAKANNAPNKAIASGGWNAPNGGKFTLMDQSVARAVECLYGASLVRAVDPPAWCCATGIRKPFRAWAYPLFWLRAEEADFPALRSFVGFPSLPLPEALAARHPDYVRTRREYLAKKERKAARAAGRAADARAEAKLAKAKADWQPGAGQKKK